MKDLIIVLGMIALGLVLYDDYTKRTECAQLVETANAVASKYNQEILAVSLERDKLRQQLGHVPAPPKTWFQQRVEQGPILSK